MVRRTSAVRRRGLNAYKVHELLMGVIKYPLKPYYTGYGNWDADHGRDNLTENYITDAMREDWEEHREALLAFWRSGEYTTTDSLAVFGLNVRMPPWLFVRGSSRTLPWAAQQFK
jgi:hypothetical protein